jgi:voltage-gated potassium channel
MEVHEETILEHERNQTLEQLECWLEWPMIVLGFGWLLLLIVELNWGLSRFLELLSRLIWLTFIGEFAVKFTVAPRKMPFLKKSWLTAIALMIPALRVFRIFELMRVLRVARVARGLRLVGIVASVNRGMRVLGRAMERRGLGYVVALTAIVTVAGAAGMYAFERDVPGGLDSYGVALWWTAMLLTSIASEYWPKTAEGRLLCLLLSVYGFAVFGYMTASLASFFIGRDAEQEVELASARSIRELRAEIVALRSDPGGRAPQPIDRRT